MAKNKREKKNKQSAAREAMHKPQELFVVHERPNSRPAGMSETSPNTWTTGSMETNIEEMLKHLKISPATEQSRLIKENNNGPKI